MSREYPQIKHQFDIWHFIKVIWLFDFVKWGCVHFDVIISLAASHLSYNDTKLHTTLQRVTEIVVKIIIAQRTQNIVYFI